MKKIYMQPEADVIDMEEMSALLTSSSTFKMYNDSDDIVGEGDEL